MQDISKLEIAVRNLSNVLSNHKVSQAHIQDLHAGMESLDIPIANPNIRAYSRVLSDIGLESANVELEQGRYALTQLNYENSKKALSVINNSIERIVSNIKMLKNDNDINQEVVDAFLDESSWRYNSYNVNAQGEIGRATETIEDSIFNPYVLRGIVAKLFDTDTMATLIMLQENNNKFSPFLNWVASSDLEKIVFDLEFNVNDIFIKDILNLIVSDKISVALDSILLTLTEYYLNSFRYNEFSPEEIKSLVEVTKLDEIPGSKEEIDKEYWGLVNTKYHSVFNDDNGIELFLYIYRLIYSKPKK